MESFSELEASGVAMRACVCVLFGELKVQDLRFVCACVCAPERVCVCASFVWRKGCGQERVKKLSLASGAFEIANGFRFWLWTVEISEVG